MSEIIMNVDHQKIADILKNYKKITVIGLSRDDSKPALKVPLYMESHGYELVGVRPDAGDIKNFKCYTSLADVPKDFRKFVNVFRRSEFIPQVVDDVIKMGGVEILWLQMGITHPEAEAKAEKAGIKVVSDRCLHIEHSKINH